MRYVELVPGVKSSTLAFGCAPILGAIGRRQAEAAIATALEVGITHFDVARSYGFGEAEKLVGRSLAGVRDRVVIATKFGFEATPLARLLGPVKPLIRLLRGKHTNHAKAADGGGAAGRSSGVSRLQCRIKIDVPHMRHSVEQSLRALRTDYIDYLFMHEPLPGEFSDEVLQEAAALKASGKIRGFGAAGFYHELSASSDWLARMDLCQFDLSIASPHYREAVALRGERPNVLFSVLRNRPRSVSVVETLQKLHVDLPHSVILAAMFDPKHVRANAATLA